MSRILITALVLAALSVSSANGLPVYQAKPHRNARTTAALHKAPAKLHHATPEEVGRAAGLKIRRDLARHPLPAAAPHRQPRLSQKPAPRALRYSQKSREVRSRRPVRSPRFLPVSASVIRTPSRIATLPPATMAAPSAPDNPFTQPDDTSLEPDDASHQPDDASQTTPAPASSPELQPTPPEVATAEPDPAVPADETIPAEQKPDVLTTSLHLKHGVLPPPLKGSRASLERQNERTEAEGLERIEDEDDLADRIARKMLVPVPVSLALTINTDLPANHRYCRPWTARFLSDLAKSHAAEFHRPLEVSSAVRTVAYQKRLMGINGNAAAAEGDIVSPHLTGATIDIAKSPLSREEIGWMRSHLLALEDAGKIDVEEEFQQSCFHITVYKSYAPPAPSLPRKSRQHRSNPPAEIASKGL